MSESATVAAGVLRVLVVGDSDRIDATVDALASAFDPTAVLRERTVSAALERLTETDVQCIVCEFDGDIDAGVDADGDTDRLDGDGRSALDHLADRTDVPIVAVLDHDDGRDHEDVARDPSDATERALDAGATDVVEPGDSRPLVATRIANAARQHRLAAAESERSSGSRRYRSILESSDALVLVVESDGAIEYASPVVESRLGYTPSELERSTIDRLVHPEDREDVRELVSAVAEAPFGTTERATVRAGDAGGTWRLVELTCANRLDDPLIEGLVVTVAGGSTGMGGGIETEAGPAGGAVPVQTALDRLAEPFFAVGPDWELRFANTASRELFEGEPTPGTIVWELLPAAVRDRFDARLREAAATGSPVQFVVTVDDRRFAVTAYPTSDVESERDSDPEPGVSVLARAADRPVELDAAAGPEQVREPTWERLRLLESTIDALDDGVAVLENGTIRLANAALLERTVARTLVGQPVEDVFDADLAATVRERARSAVVRWMDPIQGALTTERDDRRPVDVFVTPLSDDADRTLCVVRDRRRSAAGALDTVCETIGAVRDADARAPVRRAVADGLRTCTDADLAVWYRTDEDALRPAAVATADGDPAVDLPALDRARIDDVVAERLVVDEPTVYDRSALGPVLDRSRIRAERVLVVPVDGDAVVATSTEPLAFETLDSEPSTAIADAAAIALDRLATRTRVRTCRQERSRLESLVDRAEHVRAIERDLLTAETREAVERRLCDGTRDISTGIGRAAGDSAAIERPDDARVSDEDVASGIDSAFVWIGRVATGAETVSVRTWAGSDADGEALTTATVPVASSAVAPTSRTAADRTTSVVDDLESAVTDTTTDADADTDIDTDTGSHQLLQAALDRGYRSAISVPIEHDEFLYGTLTAYAPRPAAFDEDARAAYEHLAAVAGHAIGALERKRALLADSIVELEVLVRDEDEPLSAFARHVGSRIDVQSVVPRSSGGSTVFCTVPDADADRIRDGADGIEATESLRFVGDNDVSPVELVLRESTVAATLAEYGGVLRSVTPIDDRSRLVIELASTVDVRSFVRSIDRVHAGTELVARRERDRSAPSARPFDAELRARLSERQLRTLETAYYGGFFDWPRESTGEDVADSLGVSQPTFSRHLRLAQRKLFELLFDDRSGES